jgi:CubicO group peptidase (beta-lactamase class C family)
MSETQQRISEVVYQKTRTFPNKTQVAIAVIRNGDTDYYGAIKENDNLNTIINKDSIFEIGSITKVFTATVLANLVVNKKLKLNIDINQYFDFPFKDNLKINMLSLANHTSGLPRHPTNYDTSLARLYPFAH